MNKTIAQLRILLQENSQEKIRESTQRFFKEPVALYGLKSATTKKIGKKIFSSIKSKPKKEIFAICEDLWRQGYLEEVAIACEWSRSLAKEYLPEDFKTFERWLDNYVSNWAACDMFCNHTLGSFVERYPDFIAELKSWTDSENRWKRRAAAVTLILPARKGLFLAEILEIAEKLLLDKEDLVQKGYGWMLKAASEAHQEEVFAFVLSKKAVMPRTAFRYALEKMSRERRIEAMKK